jgi:hypothetical protein
MSPRAWRSATVAMIVTVLLAAGFLLALSARADASRDHQQDQRQIGALRTELAATRRQLSQVAVTDRQANLSHLGLCFQTDTDVSTGDLDYVLLVPPQSIGGVPSCPAGSFISIVPGRH